MQKGAFAISLVISGLLIFSISAGSQDEQPRGANIIPADGWTDKPAKQLSKDEASAPAPRRDISGIWDPGNAGLQVLGAGAMPEDGKPEHQPPYTAAGLAALKLTKPTNGIRIVLPGDTNDPVVQCDPQGFPRADLYNVRTTQILQRPNSIVMLYEFQKIWRVIWTDGRQFPKDQAPRWYGYSVGKWQDDYTFVVETRFMYPGTWIDRAGRPHGKDLTVEEIFHRPDYGMLQLTVIITDPEMYTKPWIALNKLPFRLQSPHFDVTEWMCSPTELKEYNEFIGNPASSSEGSEKKDDKK